MTIFIRDVSRTILCNNFSRRRSQWTKTKIRVRIVVCIHDAPSHVENHTVLVLKTNLELKSILLLTSALSFLISPPNDFRYLPSYIFTIGNLLSSEHTFRIDDDDDKSFSLLRRLVRVEFVCWTKSHHHFQHITRFPRHANSNRCHRYCASTSHRRHLDRCTENSYHLIARTSN